MTTGTIIKPIETAVEKMKIQVKNLHKKLEKDAHRITEERSEDNAELPVTKYGKHQYVFMVYKDRVNGTGADVVGIFSSMEEAVKLQKIVSRGNVFQKNDPVIISQIPINSHIPTHSEYVMKVLC